MTAEVVIVLLNWNRWRDTLECLESVYNLDYSSFSVVVVDNASTDDSRERILEWVCARNREPVGIKVAPKPPLVLDDDIGSFTSDALSHGEFVYVQSSHNGGFASGCNLGIRLALISNANYVWLLNNDTTVDPNALTGLVLKTESDKSTGMCGSLLCYYHDHDIVQAVGGVKFNYYRALGRQLGQGQRIDDPEIKRLSGKAPTYISGASMLVRTDLFREIGLLEEGYFLYFEEIDFAERARTSCKLAISIDSVVFHKEGSTIGTASLSARSPLSQYYLNRNLIRFYALRRPLLLPIALMRVCREMLACLLKQDFRLFGTTCKALFHSLTGRFGIYPLEKA